MCGNDNPMMSLTDGDGFNCVIDVPLEMLSEIIFEFLFFVNFQSMDTWTKMPTFIPHRSFSCQHFRCKFVAFFLELSEM